MNKRELIENLKAEDPDYVVDVLEITSEELLAKFPRHLARHIASEIGCQTEEKDDD